MVPLVSYHCRNPSQTIHSNQSIKILVLFFRSVSNYNKEFSVTLEKTTHLSLLHEYCYFVRDHCCFATQAPKFLKIMSFSDTNSQESKCTSSAWYAKCRSYPAESEYVKGRGSFSTQIGPSSESSSEFLTWVNFGTEKSEISKSALPHTSRCKHAGFFSQESCS